MKLCKLGTISVKPDFIFSESILQAEAFTVDKHKGDRKMFTNLIIRISYSLLKPSYSLPIH